MARYDNVNGIWTKANKRYNNVNGIWTKANKRYENMGGIWMQSYSSEIPAKFKCTTAEGLDYSYANGSVTDLSTRNTLSFSCHFAGYGAHPIFAVEVNYYLAIPYSWFPPNGTTMFSYAGTVTYTMERGTSMYILEANPISDNNGSPDTELGFGALVESSDYNIGSGSSYVTGNSAISRYDAAHPFHYLGIRLRIESNSKGASGCTISMPMNMFTYAPSGEKLYYES